MATGDSKEQTLEERQRAYQAAMMVEHNELLIWHAMERNEVRYTHFHSEIPCHGKKKLL
jgi:hypothetical protein